MRRILFAFALLLILAVVVGSQTNVSSPTPTQDAATGGTGVAVPSKALYAAGNGSGNLTGLITCDSSVAISVSTAATTQLVALVAGKTIYVCHYDFMSAGTTNVTLEYGTGINCATGTTTLTGAYPTIAQTGVSAGEGLGAITKTASGNAFCIVNSAAVQVSGLVTYTQF